MNDAGSPDLFHLIFCISVPPSQSKISLVSSSDVIARAKLSARHVSITFSTLFRRHRVAVETDRVILDLCIYTSHYPFFRRRHPARVDGHYFTCYPNTHHVQHNKDIILPRSPPPPPPGPCGLYPFRTSTIRIWLRIQQPSQGLEQRLYRCHRGSESALVLSVIMLLICRSSSAYAISPSFSS